MYYSFTVPIPKHREKLPGWKKEISHTFSSKLVARITRKRNTRSLCGSASENLIQTIRKWCTQIKSFLTDIFSDSPMPEERPEAYRSCVLRIGTYIVIQNVLKEHKLPGMLGKTSQSRLWDTEVGLLHRSSGQKNWKTSGKKIRNTVFLLRSFTHCWMNDIRNGKIERAKQALYNAYVESERSLDEIIDLIRNVDEWI